MNIFNTCQTNNYSSDYTKTKKERAQAKDIKIIIKQKKQRRINNTLPFDLNKNNRSKIDYNKNNITKPIESLSDNITYIDPDNKLFNSNCPHKYLDYIDVSQNCF